MLPVILKNNSQTSLPSEKKSNEVSTKEIIFNLYKTVLEANNKTPEEMTSALADQITAHFDQLNQQENKNSPDLASPLQEAITLLALNLKTELNGSLSQYDIITALDVLANKGTDQIKNTVERCKNNDVEFVIKNGVENYNKKTGKTIFLNTKVFITSPEIHFNINQFLCLHDNINQAQASKLHRGHFEDLCNSRLNGEHPMVIEEYHFKYGMSAKEMFLLHPECWKDIYLPRYEKGRNYLHSLGIGGPLTNRAIERGELAVENALKRRELVLLDIKTKVNELPAEQRDVVNKLIDGGEADGAVKYIVDGSLTFEQAVAFTNLRFINHTKIQRYIDTDKLTLEQVSNLTDKQAGTLAVDFVYSLIDNGAKTVDYFLEQAEKITEPIFCYVSVEHYLKTGFLTIESCFELESFTLVCLGYEGVQKYIENGKLTLAHLLKNKNAMLSTLRNTWYHQYIDSDQVAIEDVINLSYAHQMFFITHGRTYVDSGKLSINQAITLTYDNGLAALCNKGIRKLILNDELAINEAIKLTMAEILVLGGDEFDDGWARV